MHHKNKNMAPHLKRSLSGFSIHHARIFFLLFSLCCLSTTPVSRHSPSPDVLELLNLGLFFFNFKYLIALLTRLTSGRPPLLALQDRYKSNGGDGS